MGKRLKAESLAARSRGVGAFLRTLPPERAVVLEGLARVHRCGTVEQLAVELLSQALRTEESRRADSRVRDVIRSEVFARRWAKSLADCLKAAMAKGVRVQFIAVNLPLGRATAHEEYPRPQRGVIEVIDVRAIWVGELADEQGEITPRSVGAWLTGRAKPRGDEDREGGPDD